MENQIRTEPTEKEKLELIEKKVEIRKKRLEINKERVVLSKLLLEKEKEALCILETKTQIRNKELENLRTEIELEDLINRRNFDEARILREKIFSVLIPLIAETIDSERTILGSEPFYKNLLSEKNKSQALDKLMTLINKL